MRLWASIVVIVVFVVVVAGAGSMVCYWSWLHGAPSETIRNISLVIAAAVAIILAMWRSVVAVKQTEATRDQANAAQKQIATTQQSLRIERFQSAVQLIGSDIHAVRMGAIDSLLRLAKFDPKGFHTLVFRILAAFVRCPPSASEKKRSRRPREDIQTIIVGISKRSIEGRELEKEHDAIIDLQGAKLQNVWFPPSACLDRVRLCRTKLSGAILSGVRGLKQSQLHGACAKLGREPKLDDAFDPDTGMPLIWPPPGSQ